jgi:single-strand DNA-binding protein
MPNGLYLEVLGHLGRDPERRPAGARECVKFSVAAQPKKDAPPVWVSVTTWGKDAEYAEKYLRKGNAVRVRGRAELRTYTTKEGVERTELAVSASEVNGLGGGREDRGEQPRPEARQDTPLDDDMPF